MHVSSFNRPSIDLRSSRKSKILVNGEVNVLDSQIIKRFDKRGQESNLIDKDFFIFSRVSLGFFFSHDKSHDVTL